MSQVLLRLTYQSLVVSNHAANLVTLTLESHRDDFVAHAQNVGRTLWKSFSLCANIPNLLAVYFSLDQNESISRTDPEDVYTLLIILIYDADKEGKEAENAAVSAATTIKQLFRNEYKKDGNWKLIELQDCLSMPETSFSTHSARKMRQWLGF